MPYAFLSLPCVVSVSDPGLSVANIASQLQDTKARVVVVAQEAAPRYLEANTQLPPEQRVRHILVLGLGACHKAAHHSGTCMKMMELLALRNF